MIRPNPWEALRRGDAEQGLALAREAYTRKPNASHIMELGVAYLWVDDYKSAETHFQNAIESDPFTTSSFFEMAGVASWYADNPVNAIGHWRKGLGSQFADAGVALSLPLLLFVTSILRPNVFSQKEAERILKNQMENPRAQRWPGPLAEFVSGRIDEAALAQSCAYKREDVTQNRRWRAQFYEDIVGFGRGNLDQKMFRELMQRTVDTSLPEWSEERSFLSLLWNPEFFVARYEANR